MPPEVGQVVDALIWALGRLWDALPTLLGGAGGVLLVWWFDGRREQRRERHRLQSAALVVGTEMAANIAQADQWAGLPDRLALGESVEELEAGPVEMRTGAWLESQLELANGLPRETFLQLAAAYALSGLFAHNIPVAMRRGHLVNEDLLLSQRVRDTFQAALRVLQAFEQRHLGVRFDQVPIGPAEERAARTAAPRSGRKGGNPRG